MSDQSGKQRPRNMGVTPLPRRVSDKLADVRARVTTVGDDCFVKLEDLTTGSLFALCPASCGLVRTRRSLAAEPIALCRCGTGGGSRTSSR